MSSISSHAVVPATPLGILPDPQLGDIDCFANGMIAAFRDTQTAGATQ